jgi:hypothetical protein
MFAGDDGDGGDSAAKGSVPATDDLSATAIRACLAAVARETQERDVAVLSSEYSEANSVVMVGVGAKRAPWRCLSSNAGEIAEIMFAGDDGDGGDGAAPVPNFERPVGGVMPAGSGFTATGQISCVRERDAASAMCDFGVIREGGGKGSITVFWPVGGNRVIFFKGNKPSSYDQSEADGGAQMTVDENNGMFSVRIGDQRFELFEAIMTGG